MKAVILAGGLGTRLSEETDRRPKPMVEVGGRPLLWHIMKLYAQHGVDQFVVCLGYRGWMIKEYFLHYAMHASDVTVDLRTGDVEVHQARAEPWKVTLVDTGLHTMTGGRLSRVRAYLDDEPFCMTYGDGVGDVDIGALLKHHEAHGKLATVTAVRPPGRFGALQMDGAQVTGFVEKPPGDGGWINGGFFVLSPGALDYAGGDESVWEQGPMERIAADGQMTAFRHDGFWRPMDTLRDKRRLEELWETGNAPWRVWP